MKLFEMEWNRREPGDFVIQEGIQFESGRVHGAWQVDLFTQVKTKDNRDAFKIGSSLLILREGTGYGISRQRASIRKTSQDVLELIEETSGDSKARALVLINMWSGGSYWCEELLDLSHVPTENLLAHETLVLDKHGIRSWKPYHVAWLGCGPKTIALVYMEPKQELTFVTRLTKKSGWLWWRKVQITEERWLLRFNGTSLTCTSPTREEVRAAADAAIRIY